MQGGANIRDARGMKPRQRAGATDASVCYRVNYALQSICPLIARHRGPGHDVLHATFPVLQYSPVSEGTLLLWEDAGVH